MKLAAASESLPRRSEVAVVVAVPLSVAYAIESRFVVTSKAGT
jgi:hypothetical protein